jgi:glutamine synthetase
MTPGSEKSVDGVTSIRELDQWIDREGIRYFKVGVFDIDGVMRGKYINREKLRSAVDKGFGFCDVVLGWDSQDELYAFDRTGAGETKGIEVSGWHTGYSDAIAQLDLSTLRRIPMEEDTLLLIGSFQGNHANVCPRTILSRTLDKATAMGFAVDTAFEYEFFLFDETPDSVREKGYRNLQHFTPGMFGYSVLRSSVHAEFYHDLLDLMEDFDCAIEGLHTETGPGVIEAAIRYARGLEAADRASLFKTFTKVFAQRAGLMATFMAKWSNDYPGQSGHLHISLCDAKTGENAFYGEGDPSNMSKTMCQFVAGQVRYMPELLAMVCSTINSYRRLVPGMWAPTAANWGVENRTTSVRVIPAGAEAQRSEYRIAPADANPYLAQAAALASGLRGIEEGLELPEVVVGNGYEDPKALVHPLPSTLREASVLFRASDMARSEFGNTFVDHYATTRDWEDQENRKAVSDWDLARYFEII